MNQFQLDSVQPPVQQQQQQQQRESCLVLIKNRFIQKAFDVVVLVFLFIVALLCNLVMEPYDRFFLERDPSLSYPYEALGVQTVPNTLLFVLVIPVPLVFLLCWVLLWRGLAKSQLEVRDNRLLDPLLVVLAFGEAVALTLSLTEFLKNFVGRKRPNFFAMCNYKGFRTALQTGNFTLYDQLTTYGMQGDMSFCLETSRSILRNSQYSFPSGHSSLSFCALVFSGLVALNMLHNYTPRHNLVKAVLLLFCIWSSSTIASTRPRDYWHNFEDILTGAIIGSVMGIFAFYLNYVTKYPTEEEENGYVGKEILQ